MFEHNLVSLRSIPAQQIFSVIQTQGGLNLDLFAQEKFRPLSLSWPATTCHFTRWSGCGSPG